MISNVFPAVYEYSLITVTVRGVSRHLEGHQVWTGFPEAVSVSVGGEAGVWDGSVDAGLLLMQILQ